MNKRENAFKNRANLNKNEALKNKCDNCSEDMIFEMRDNHHDFTMPLSTILQCLKLAEDEGGVAPLPQEWWRFMHCRYPYILNRYKLNKSKS